MSLALGQTDLRTHGGSSLDNVISYTQADDTQLDSSPVGGWINFIGHLQSSRLGSKGLGSPMLTTWPLKRTWR